MKYIIFRYDKGIRRNLLAVDSELKAQQAVKRLVFNPAIGNASYGYELEAA